MPTCNSIKGIGLQPISEIIREEFTNSDVISNELLVFCYKAAIRAVKVCVEGKYSEFDALTTSNCCHGMALYVKELLKLTTLVDLNKILLKLETDLVSSKNPIYLPKILVELTRLHLLCFISVKDVNRGSVTTKKKLQDISKISTKFCNRIINALQKSYSNLIANKYHRYLMEMNNELHINDNPLNVWGKYVHPEYLRVDQSGVHYASNLFSMQVSLAHLIHSKSKIAFINDLIGSNGQLRGRYISIFQGDGQGNFVQLDIEKMEFHDHEPVVVFGGCAYSNDDLNKLHIELDQWKDRLPSLFLACDVKYPHFPKASNDPNFDSSKLEPEENQLKNLIEELSKINGVCSVDPSLFCLAHIYTASMKQIRKVYKKDDEIALPISSIPLNRLSADIIKQFNLLAN